MSPDRDKCVAAFNLLDSLDVWTNRLDIINQPNYNPLMCENIFVEFRLETYLIIRVWWCKVHSEITANLWSEEYYWKKRSIVDGYDYFPKELQKIIIYNLDLFQ